jgi:hypothetical protein
MHVNDDAPERYRGLHLRRLVGPGDFASRFCRFLRTLRTSHIPGNMICFNILVTLSTGLCLHRSIQSKQRTFNRHAQAESPLEVFSVAEKASAAKM